MSAERKLVAFLTKTDVKVPEKLSPDQLALGAELRRARAHAAKAGVKAATAPVAASKRPGPKV